VRQSVKRVLTRNDAGSAGCLRANLIAASTVSAPELGKENLFEMGHLS